MLSRIRKAQEDEGFTLIELLVVIMIIGILSAIAVPTFLNQRTKGYDKAAMAELSALAIAQESLSTETGAYAPTVAGADLTALQNQSFRRNPDVNLTAKTGNTTTTWCFSAVHKNGTSPANAFYITQVVTSPTAGVCP